MLFCEHSTKWLLWVEFVSDGDEEAGIIALVHQPWLTPLKNQVWWPPYKTSAQFKKALFIEEEVKKDTWTLYNVKRVFFACGMYYTYMYIVLFVFCIIVQIEFKLLLLFISR